MQARKHTTLPITRATPFVALALVSRFARRNLKYTYGSFRRMDPTVRYIYTLLSITSDEFPFLAIVYYYGSATLLSFPR